MTTGEFSLGANALRLWMREHRQISERAMALTIAKYQGDRWRYNHDEEVWLQWVGTHWARRQTLPMLNEIGNFMMKLSKALAQGQLITNAEAIKFQSQRAAAAVERICRALVPFDVDASIFDPEPFDLGTPGGTIDLRTGEMRPANPDDHITILTKVTPAPPGTPLGPRFKKFLSDITNGDEDFQLTLQQWMGISAQGTSRDQRIFFLYGGGGNGKGVLLRTVAGLLGEYAAKAPDDLLMRDKYSRHGTHLIDTVRARMAMATEVGENAAWDVALIKSLTGGDVVKVNRMRQDPFNVLPTCSITISGNKKPALTGLDDAIKRRFLVATFALKLKPGEVIPDLEKEFIREEGPAILRWVIDGSVAREVAGALHVAHAIQCDTEDYFEEENDVQEFINGYLVPRPAGEEGDWKVETGAVFEVWRGFCRANSRPVGARNSFTTAMKAAGIEYHRTKAGRFFLNVRLGMGVKLGI